jgi:PAS domain S-box-containing protein
VGDWIFPVAIAPIVCCGIAFSSLGPWRHAFLGVLGAPLAGAAILFEAPVVWTAYVVSAATCFLMLAPDLGVAGAGANTAVFAIVIGLVVWVVYGKSWRVRALVRAMPDVLVRADAEGRFLDVHRPSGEVVSAPKDALLGHRVYEFVPPEVRDRMRTAIDLALATDSVQAVHYAVPYEGAPRHFEARFVRSGPGEVLVIRREVTARAEMESRLRESEERYRSVVSSMVEGVILREADGAIVTCNAAAERILGLTAAQMQGNTTVSPAWPMVREDGSPLPPEEHPAQATLRTGQAVSGAVVGIAKPAGITWISVNAEPLRRQEGGPPYGVVTTFADITEMKRQQDLLRESQRQLALVLEGSNDGFWDLDLRSTRFTFSPRCFEIVGEKPQDVMTSAEYWWGRLHPDDVSTVRDALDGHLQGRTERIDAVYRLRDASGSWKWVRALGMAVERHQDGRPTRLAGTLRDVTARREVQEQLRAALDENEKLVGELRQALQNVKTLSGLVPVCAWCHKIRNDAGYWEKIEAYVSQHTEARFTHALCPECYSRQFPEDKGRS